MLYFLKKRQETVSEGQVSFEELFLEVIFYIIRSFWSVQPKLNLLPRYRFWTYKLLHKCNITCIMNQKMGSFDHTFMHIMHRTTQHDQWPSILCKYTRARNVRYKYSKKLARPVSVHMTVGFNVKHLCQKWERTHHSTQRPSSIIPDANWRFVTPFCYCLLFWLGIRTFRCDFKTFHLKNVPKFIPPPPFMSFGNHSQNLCTFFVLPFILSTY